MRGHSARNYKPPKGPLQNLAAALFVVGLALNVVNLVVLDDDGKSWVAWTAIVLMCAGVLLSMWLLLVQWRKQR